MKPQPTSVKPAKSPEPWKIAHGTYLHVFLRTNSVAESYKAVCAAVIADHEKRQGKPIKLWGIFHGQELVRLKLFLTKKEASQTVYNEFCSAYYTVRPLRCTVVEKGGSGGPQR